MRFPKRGAVMYRRASDRISNGRFCRSQSENKAIMGIFVSGICR